MKFTRVGEHTIKCMLSEAEVQELGFTIDEILANGARTQEFMNQIFELAEQEYQIKFDQGIKTVRADFLPDHSLALTFSEHPVSDMVEHLQDIFDEIMKQVPQEKIDQIQAAQAAKGMGPGKGGQEASEGYQETRVIALFTFPTMEVLCNFASHVNMEEVPNNSLYKSKDKFVLVMELTDCEEAEVMRLSMLTDEYATDIQVGPEKKAYLEEHGRCLIKKTAIQQLQQL